MSIFNRMMFFGLLSSIVTGVFIGVSQTDRRGLMALGFYVMFNLWQIGANIAAEISKAIRESKND